MMRLGVPLTLIRFACFVESLVPLPLVFVKVLNEGVDVGDFVFAWKSNTG